MLLSDPLDSGRYTRKQLDKKFKHAIDFGINDTKKNCETLTKFRDALEAHLADKGMVEKGTYRREKGSKVFFNTKTNNVVVLDKDGVFITTWHLTPGSPKYNNYINTGVL
ncbi:colicin D domain-containing protein [Serratia aquatilis]|uniref:Colicin D domain-containing protein n=1 Tax=Serratia aquatilis TaxID=1737515 RepID=A0ABV6EHK1_9GAMM